MSTGGRSSTPRLTTWVTIRDPYSCDPRDRSVSTTEDPSPPRLPRDVILGSHLFRVCREVLGTPRKRLAEVESPGHRV